MFYYNADLLTLTESILTSRSIPHRLTEAATHADLLTLTESTLTSRSIPDPPPPSGSLFSEAGASPRGSRRYSVFLAPGLYRPGDCLLRSCRSLWP